MDNLENTKLIPLTQGKFAIVDAEDYEELIKRKWYFAGDYACTKQSKEEYGDSKRKALFMHRMINKTPDLYYTDHINGHKLDNRKINLRNCTSAENSRNRNPRKDNVTSKYIGVSWNKRDKIFYATIKINNKSRYIGIFKCEKAAALAYNKVAKTAFGEFARLNVI